MIPKIKMYDQKLIETDEGYEIKAENVQEEPCIITNKALKEARDNGNIKTALMSDLISMWESEDSEVEDEKITTAVYVGYIGGQLLKGNKKYLSYDEFLEKYHDSITEKGVIYQEIMMADTKNAFAESIERSVDKSSKKGEKK